jgi:hypothetical protein
MTLFMVAWRLFFGQERGGRLCAPLVFNFFWPEACVFSAWCSFGIGPIFGLPEVLFYALASTTPLWLASFNILSLLLSWLSLFVYFFHSDRHNG